MTDKHLNFFILSITLVCTSCATSRFSSKAIDVNGMVYDFANRPVPYCEISLGRKITGSTDINGRFTLPRVPPGTYAITGYKDGYESYSDEVIIRDRGQIIYIRIPSQMQLLNLVDEALTSMNFDIADEYIQRAYKIDRNNIEMLFYYATIRYRQHRHDEAINFLMVAKGLGSKDIYIDKFLSILRELTDAEN